MSTSIAPRKTEKSERPATELSRGAWSEFGLPSLNRLRHEFDELWGKFYNEVPALWNAERADARWAFDIADQPDAYVITAEAPGFEAADFDVELRGDRLVLQAKKTKEKNPRKRNRSCRLSSIARCRFQRMWPATRSKRHTIREF